MNTYRISSRACLITVVLLTAIFTLAVPANAERLPYSRIITIGDSLSDTGNLFALTGGAAPPPPYYEGRFSNGPVWTESLAAQLRMELLPEDQYAVGGAFTGPGNLNGPFPGMEEQILRLLQNHPDGLDRHALHTLWIGANDFFATLYAVMAMDPTAPDYQQNVAQAFLSMVETGVANTADAVQVLADAGACHVLVVNLPDLGLTPMGTAQGAEMSAFLSFWVDTYNGALDAALDALAANGTETIRLDAAGILREMVADPEMFGLINATDPGLEALMQGEDPSGFLFWDSVHPGAEGHEAVAERAVDTLLDFYAHGRAPRSPRALIGLVRAYEGRKDCRHPRLRHRPGNGIPSVGHGHSR